jgi:poly(A) polymerase
VLNVTPKPHLHQDWIDPHAIGIVRALQKAGFKSYLVGGCVRDLLIGIHPKDFDIATDAKPDEVKRIIHRAYVIGKRFRLVLVRREEQQFEVATFRREIRADENAEDLPEGDNIFGTEEDDAQRRDFTINGLFYDPINDQLIDYAEGLPDLDNKWVRMIGDPGKRLNEDPIRILRALRLKHMIGFCLDPALREAMKEHASTLLSTVLPRRREEILKLLRLKHPDLALREAQDLGIMQFLSPTLSKHLESENGELFFENLRQHKANLGDGGGDPGELFAVLVHSFVRAFLEADPHKSSRSVFENEEFQAWMRDELGMFKHEQALTVKALHVESLLARRKEFQRKGERRQRALLSNDAFSLAFRFATQDYLLSCEDLLYWSQAFDELLAKNPDGLRGSGDGSGGGDRGRRRRRTRRPRRGAKRNPEEARS